MDNAPIEVLQTSIFRRAVRKLHANQKSDLDSAINDLIANPKLGDAKVGDLKGILVYKFRMVDQSALLAYIYTPESITLTLLALGSHENFYRDLKK